jgi:hypothetical protein
MSGQVGNAAVLGAVCWLAIPLAARGQALPPALPAVQEEPQTREAALLALRQEKATRTVPNEPGTLEKGVAKLENDRILEDWLSAGPGGRYYLQFGGITTGAGFGLGPGLRLHRLADGLLDFNAFGVVSYRRYLLAETSLTAPRLARGRTRVAVLARRKYFPQEDFFGIGPDAPRPLRVSFTYEETAVGAYAGRRVGPFLDVEARAEYLKPDVGEGTDSRIPSIEQVFTDATAPGLVHQPDFVLARLASDFNYSTPVGNPRRGGRYHASIWRYMDRDTGHYTFNRLEVDLRQYVPFLQERRVLALRTLASFSAADSGDEVPFYFQRTLGGSDTLRGFRDYRFRDRNLLLFQAEYRWEIFPALDAALFYDTGKVGPTVDDLSRGEFERDYGFGFRFGTNRGVYLRVDAAFGSRDGKRYFIKWSNSF